MRLVERKKGSIMVGMREKLQQAMEAVRKKKAGIVIAVIILAIASAGYFYYRFTEAQKRIANPTLIAQEEAKKITDAVGKLVVLPSDETPTIATVNDKEKLKNQAFFASAENGDKVLIYTNAKKAILYRPSVNKIIDVAPVNIGGNNQATQSGQPQQPTAQIKVILLNGTTIVGLTKTFEEQMKQKAPQVVVADRDNAKKRDYKQSVLVDLTGKKKEELIALSDTLGIKIGPLPEGESTGSADFLILLGADKK